MKKRARTSRAPRAHIMAILGIVIAVVAVALIGSTLTTPQIPHWYAALVKPPGTPPNAVFGPVWTLLYAAMAVAAFLVWRNSAQQSRARYAALLLFFIQLFLNLLWSVLFFGLQNPALALIDIIALLAAISGTIVLFYRISAPAAWLLVPYMAWVSFATYLNAGIWWLNR